MNLKSYSIVTASYWGLTLTDGALRMLVLLHFHTLGYSPVSLAFLFLLYECCGILTNLLGGWLGSRVGLKFTLHAGLALQVVALVMLSLTDPGWAVGLSVAYVMATQALSGIAKDLTKMSSKSAVKLLVRDENGALFKWVSILTGSKNTLKGVGFLLGGVLLTWLGFAGALWTMACGLALVLLAALLFLKQDMGRTKVKVKFTQLFSKSREMNWLSAARLFLFASRDVWFVVALPVFLKDSFDWSFNQVGSFMAAWVIGYGTVQSLTPRLIARRPGAEGSETSWEVRAATVWALALACVSAAIAGLVAAGFAVTVGVIGGLACFGIVFAVNSSLHSYLILAYADGDDVSIDVGFYYSANAAGRLVGTLLSGLLYLQGGIEAALWGSAIFVAATWLLPLRLPTLD